MRQKVPNIIKILYEIWPATFLDNQKFSENIFLYKEEPFLPKRNQNVNYLDQSHLIYIFYTHIIYEILQMRIAINYLIVQINLL